MNILCGSHSTGKSTLLEHLNKIDKNIYTSDGFSRPVKLAKSKLKFDNLSEQIIINELTEWAFLNYLDKNVFTARSPIDAIVYSNLLFPDLDTTSLKETLYENLDKVENIFYIPIEFEIQNDGVRFIDPDFQQQVDLAIQDFLLEDKIAKKVIILQGTIQERIDLIKGKI